MNFERLKQVLELAKRKAPHPEIARLIDSFREFFDLYHKRNQVHTDPMSFYCQLHDAYRTVFEGFERISKILNLPRELLGQHLKHPAQFTPEQWQSNEIQGKGGRAFLTQGSNNQPIRKKLSKKNKLRI